MIKTIFSTLCVLALPLAGYASEYQIEQVPRQECWDEQVPVQPGGSGHGAAIVGGIAGGLLGNQVGAGTGRTAATAAGAIAGTIIGDRMSARGGPYGSHQTVRRCRTVVDQVRVPVPVVAYYPSAAVLEQGIYDAEQSDRWYRAQWRQEQWRRQQWREEQWRREQWRRDHSHRKHWKHHRDSEDGWERSRRHRDRDDD